MVSFDFLYVPFFPTRQILALFDKCDREKLMKWPGIFLVRGGKGVSV